MLLCTFFVVAYFLLIIYKSLYRVKLFLYFQLKEVCRSGTDVNEKFPYDIDPQHFDMTPLALAAALDRRNHAKVGLNLHVFFQTV